MKKYNNRIEITRLIDQIELLFNGENWVGLNLEALFNDIDDYIANYKMPAFNKTIHQIARHIVSDFIVIRRLQGIDYKLAENESWPSSDEISCTWLETVTQIKRNKTELIDQLNNISDEILNQTLLPGQNTIYFNIFGFIQHAYYHFGQIVILQKTIEEITRNNRDKTTEKEMNFNSLIPELSVKEISVSKAFYINLLGFKVDFEREDENFLHISLGKSQLMLIEDQNSWITGALIYPRGRGINFQIECNNVFHLYNKIKRIGVNIFEKIQENKYTIGDKEEQVLEFLIQDPDGYLLRFQEYTGNC